MTLIQEMSSALKLQERYLLGLARSASHRYKNFTIPKRTGGVRQIHHPAKPLKAVQRWLLREKIDGWAVHDAATAYRKGSGIADNARVHVKSKFLLRIDMTDFFPSILRSDVITYLKSKQAWTDADCVFFADIVCRNGALTIGAPTSPSLSNALCRDLDVELFQLADGVGAKYTRYADDLFFSCSTKDVLGPLETRACLIIGGHPCPGSLKVNVAKTRHTSKKGRRVVTGLVLGSDGNLSVGREMKRRIRSKIHKLSTLSPGERLVLAGELAFAKDVEPHFIDRLVMKYGPKLVGDAQSP